MRIKTKISWMGKPPGTVIEIEDKHYPYVLKNNIGEKVIDPVIEDKMKKPKYKKKNDTNASIIN